MVNYADDPLVLTNFYDEQVASVVSRQLTGNLVGAVGIADLVEIGVDIPLIFLQEGDEVLYPFNIDAPDAGFGIGDIRIIPKVMLLGPDDLFVPQGPSLALLVDVHLPTGDLDSYQGGEFRAQPEVAFDYLFNEKYRLGAVLGYAIRPDETVLNVESGDALTWSIAASIQVAESLDLVPTIFGDLYLAASDLDLEEAPMEAVLGLKWEPLEGFLLEAGGAAGVIRGIGTPDYRLFLGLAYSDVPHPDTDGDGISDKEDECPEVREDFDDFQDEDGCPDTDNDNDGRLDVVDNCPMVPEDHDGFEDEDGCPDPDNDGDGILDGDDGCPMEPEDVDTFEDDDGCPDPDNDEDGILDVDDACPLEPETFNGITDEDGCPDMVLLTCTAIELGDRVYFETAMDIIQERSFGLLNAVAEVLIANPDVIFARIDGHTDSRATDEYNLDLSQRRAMAVLRYLVDHGVEETRLAARGYGESQPIADNDTEEGRALNRRVEFIVLQQEGCDPPVEAAE